MLDQKKNKTVIIGLWGLPWPELLRWVKSGELPFLRTLLAEGATGTLEPTLPGYFSVAWATWLSGQNPGRHGVFNDQKETRPAITGEYYHFSGLGEILANNGYNIISFNLPARLTHKSDKNLKFISPKISGENPEGKLEEWSKHFSAFLQTQDWDFLAAALDFNWLFHGLTNFSLKLSLLKKWDDSLAKNLSLYHTQMNLILLGAPQPSWPEAFSLEKFLETQGFLKQRTKKGGEIDFRNTLAYPAGEKEIKLNLKGREPQGKVEPGREFEELRDQLIQKLMNFYGCDPAAPQLKIYKKEELFSGEFLEGVPDILLDFQDNQNRGFFIFSGPPFNKPKELTSYQGIDIAPTILYLMGQEIPAQMEGQIIKEAFNQDFLQSNPSRPAAKREEKGESLELSAEKLDRIIERLKGMGYLT